MNKYQQELEERAKNSLLRTLPDSADKIDFYSNDYLGLARSDELYQSIEAEYHSIQERKTGSTGSRLLSGNSEYAEQLEKHIAKFHKTESALIFGSGYSANIGLLSALGKRGTNFISDELIHASMIDGVRLGYAGRYKFQHNDVQDLVDKMEKIEGDKIVLTESIYSMDGDIAPLEEILEVCKNYDAHLIVDEAHAIGVAGGRGEGYCASLGIQDQVLATIVTYGKAMGIHGAAVLGDKWLVDYLMNFARSFIYSTAPSYHQLASIKCAYQINSDASDMRKALQENIAYFIEKRNQASSMNWLDSDTSIQSLIVPGNEEVIEAADALKNDGATVLPIRSPTVHEGTERLRISLHAYNTKKEIDLLFESLEKWHQNNSSLPE